MRLFSLVFAFMLVGSVVLAQDHPKFFITAARETAWAQMKTDYDAAPSAPTTVGGQMYKLIKDNADGAARYSDYGQWPTWMYHVTGDSDYVTLAWTKINSHFLVLSEASCPSDFSREYFWQYVWMYDWLYDGLTAGQRTELLDKLNWMGDCTTSASPFADSDIVVARYMGLAMLYVSTNSYNNTVATYWNDAARKIGGLTATGGGDGTASFRDAIDSYVGTLSTGGVFVEGWLYNVGTAKILLLGSDAIFTWTTVDYFPEITAWKDDVAEAFIHQISPQISETSQPWNWGDNGSPRSLRSFYSFETALVLAGANTGTATGQIMQDFVMDWVATSSVDSIDPYPRGFLLFDPYATRGNHASLDGDFYASGMGLVSDRTGWTTTDSWFMTQFSSRNSHSASSGAVHHTTRHWGTLQLWKGDEWAFTYPQCYGGPCIDSRASNGVAVRGLPGGYYAPIEYRAVTAQERETTLANYLYVSGTAGGSIQFDGTSALAETFIHELTRSVVWLPAWDLFVVHDRVNATEPTIDTVSLSEVSEAWINDSERTTLYVHTPVSPTQTSNYTDWIYSGALHSRVTHLLPAASTRTIVDESALFTTGYYQLGSWNGNEKKYHVKVVPDVDAQFTTFLNVWDAYAAGTPKTATLTQDTGNHVDGVLVSDGTTNILTTFSAIQGPNLTGVGYSSWPAGNDTVLATVRVRVTGFSLTFTPAANTTTTAILFDLDTGTSWDYNIDGGANSSLTVDANGIGVIDITDTGAITLNVLAGGAVPVIVETASLPEGTKSSAYSETLASSGGDGGPYTWSVTVGSLPSQLSLSGGGVLSGTPDTAETQVFTVQACDSDPSCGTRQLSLTIADIPNITTTSLANGTVDSAYSETVSATGGSEPYAFTVLSGSLCTGLSLASATGIISGTPTTVETCNFTIRVTDDAAATDDQPLGIKVAAGIGTVTVVVDSGAVDAVVHYGLAGLPQDSSCTLQLKDGAAVLDEVTNTTGPARRTTYFLGLTAETTYEVVVTCDMAVSSPGANYFTTIALTGSGTVTHSIALKPDAILTTADKARVTYDTVPSTGSTDSADTSCAAGCTVDLTLAKGTTYVIYHRWLDSGSATIATSANRYVAVH